MIGFYDSGSGGVHILKEVVTRNPGLQYLYYADTESFPLGDKTVDEIQKSVKKGCKYLFDNGCNLVVLVCNTASVNTIRHIQQVWLPSNYPQKQVLSITTPLLEYFEQVYSNKLNKADPGVILSTQGTVNSGFYQYEFIKRGWVNIQAIPCSGLADAIERKDSAMMLKVLENTHTHPDKIRYIVLACTHYSGAIDEIKIVYPNAEIIDPKEFTALKIIEYINKHLEYHSDIKGADIVDSKGNSLIDSYLFSCN